MRKILDIEEVLISDEDIDYEDKIFNEEVSFNN